MKSQYQIRGYRYVCRDREMNKWMHLTIVFFLPIFLIFSINFRFQINILFLSYLIPISIHRLAWYFKLFFSPIFFLAAVWTFIAPHTKFGTTITTFFFCIFFNFIFLHLFLFTVIYYIYDFIASVTKNIYLYKFINCQYLIFKGNLISNWKSILGDLI